jgi:hypothetical protein
MASTTAHDTLGQLDVFVGEWNMTTSLTSSPDHALRARTTFEWLPGRRFLIQRWEIEDADAPDGIAIVGLDTDRATLLQHYFDSRGVARVYEMAFSEKVWRLLRHSTAPDFSQRFTATFSADNMTIVGRWERSDDGMLWIHDFDLSYTRVR